MSGSDRKIGVAVIATGGRSRGVVNNLLRDSNGNVEIKAAFDPDMKLAEDSIKNLWKQPEGKVCATYQEAINTPGVEWVMVFSPNAFHCEHILAAFEAGKNVFSEKPLATEIDDCKKIYDAHLKSGKLFATGFVLRYAPLYKKAYEIIQSGKIGQVLSIDANENIAPEHGSYIMTNWRRLKKVSGPHILEKCCHDLDLINWFTGSIPSKIASFGGRDFFVSANKDLMDKYKKEDGNSIFGGWWDPHAVDTPFTSDSDMMDNQVAIMQYRNNIRVMFQATMSNAIPERRMYFSCSEGTMIIELYSLSLKYKRLGDEGVTHINFAGDGHGGGDSFIMKELYDSMVNGTLPKCSGVEGLESSVVALAIEQAKDSGEVFDLEPVWKKLNR